MDMIETRDLTKLYGEARSGLRRSTQQVAVHKLNLKVPAGAVFGLVGPTGAGKTTILRMLATLLAPTSGDASIAGYSIQSDVVRVRRTIGYMPDVFGMYADMTCAEYLDFFASCYGVPKADRATLINDLLQLVDLSHRKDDLVDRLSRGMKQRLGLARSLAHDPQVLLLDEPTAMLDPRARIEMRELIGELRGMGKTIVLSSPILADLEDMCTHAALLVNGAIKASGTLAAIRAKLRPHRVIAIRFLGEPELAMSVCRAAHGVIEAHPPPSLEPKPATTPPPTATDAAIPAPAPTTPTGPRPLNILKELLVSFNGDYNDASNLLRALMHTGVQVVSFGEEADSLESMSNPVPAPVATPEPDIAIADPSSPSPDRTK